MFSIFTSKDAFLILRMFAKCLAVNLFLSAVLMFFMLEKNCSQEYVQGPTKRPDTFENLIETKRVDENN